MRKWANRPVIWDRPGGMCRVPGGNNRGVQGSQDCRRIEDQSQGDSEFDLARRLRWGGGSWAVTPHALVSKRPRDDARRRRRRGRRRRRARRRRRGALRPSGHDTKRALVLQLGATPARKRHRSQHRRAGEGGRGRIVTSVPFPASGVNHEPICSAKGRAARVGGVDRFLGL